MRYHLILPSLSEILWTGLQLFNTSMGWQPGPWGCCCGSWRKVMHCVVVVVAYKLVNSKIRCDHLFSAFFLLLRSNIHNHWFSASSHCWWSLPSAVSVVVHHQKANCVYFPFHFHNQSWYVQLQEYTHTHTMCKGRVPKKKRIFYGLLPTRGGSARVVKKVFFFREHVE